MSATPRLSRRPDDSGLAWGISRLIVAGEQYRKAVAVALGVSVSEAVALDYLYHAGRATPSAIADQLGITAASVTALADRLAASGYAVRTTNPRDRRSILITLTDDGQRALQALFDLFVADMELALSGSAPVEWTPGLERLLAHAAASLHQRASNAHSLARLAGIRGSQCGAP